MKFLIHRFGTKFPLPNGTPLVVLSENNWNDYSFTTLFDAFIYLPNEDNPFLLGKLKIMYLGQERNEKTFENNIVSFSSLNDLEREYCSLADSFNYYDNLRSLKNEKIALDILISLRDISYDQSLLSIFENDHCFNNSLLRYSESKEILDKGGRIFGKDIVKNMRFKTRIPITTNKYYELIFNFEEHQGLPFRINLLIGSNGVGKTQVMAKLAILLSRFAGDDDENKHIEHSRLSGAGFIAPRPSLYNVVAVSFNAFDSFELPSERKDNRFRYSYCGLRDSKKSYFSESEILATIKNLTKSIANNNNYYSFKLNTRNQVRQLTKQQYFERCLIQLMPNLDSLEYELLSAGQKIVVNILLHILDKITPQSLLLLDEPETHLHPKLMTTLYLIIMDILEAFDSFAIIATHSPIIAQQVPSRSIQVLQRIDNEPVIKKPFIECFGENLSEISRNLFQTTESDRDYKSVIDNLLSMHNNDINAIENLFHGKLGMNARIYLHSKANFS
ncbi:AAA family ATPase [Aeromonas veronii]|uniref:AAA family ATPase n=1 Tax=Aeromonas veronii TaxID=654 RepID=UPI003B9F901C